MAHELKTPLGIIRNFAENLQERCREEKRDYYLEQIVGQTEEMDRLVEEMLLVSKMESEKFTLHTESLSMLELIQEQLSRLEPLAAEKGILTEIREGQDFVIKGDRNYLSIGIWNLLSNAVVYNVLSQRNSSFAPSICFTAPIKAVLPPRKSIWAWDCTWRKRSSKSTALT